ncbi:hypothetical protein MSG28_016092 [Choristoneura fumiferana]|uniref:Uncharacterized protein n=1 Tax=Choristoneura fumiferana TaxID=7141 RepID=A0ACC0K5U7_CHOFU|nr:hypothetical protein MSG28_016092 [Choristoneura fumiferana]
MRGRIRFTHSTELTLSVAYCHVTIRLSPCARTKEIGGACCHAQNPDLKVVGPCARSARIATTILLANPAVKQQYLYCCVSAWRILKCGDSPNSEPSFF